MPTNTMTFNQIATILNAIQQQATGQAAITATNTNDFVTCAKTTLETGMDPVMNAINQVMSRTIFSVRPYNRKFGLIEMPREVYGNHVRKLQIADRGFRDSDPYKWPAAYDSSQFPKDGTGQSVDQQIINKPIVLQTNFYGKNVYEDSYTVFRDQLNSAFRGPEDLASFIGMVTQNISDKMEQSRENLARAVVANFIGGILDENATGRIVHLLNEYNTLTGLSLTAQTVMQPANYKAFVQWAYARILTVSDMMTERSVQYQTTVTGYSIQRHSPKDRQKLMVYAPASNMMTTMAVADVYHSELLRMNAWESVNFWQSIKTPDTINVTPSRISSAGTVTSPENAITQSDVFAVLFDEEAMGYTVVDSSSAPAPYNARGQYTTIWLHEMQQCFNDHTEKGVVFLLD